MDAPSATAATPTVTAAALVARAREVVDELSPAEFAGRMGPGTVILDLREPHEIETGTIPGSVPVPRGMLEFRADPTSPYHQAGLDPAAPVLLYCASGGRSALAGATLRQLGYQEVGHLAGGVAAWTEAGRALS